jgi:RNA polymerase sigma factor (sigma-70 family)
MRDGDMSKKPIKLKTGIKEMTCEEICIQFKPLVFKSAKKWISKYDYEEMKQIAFIGLIKAYNSYDIQKDVLFTTYAPLVINGALGRTHRDNKSKFNVVYSLNSQLGNGEEKDFEYLDLIEDENDYENIAINNVESERLRLAIGKLESKNKKVVELLVLKEMRQVDVARILETSQAQVSRIYKRSLKELKNIIGGNLDGRQENYATKGV